MKIKRTFKLLAAMLVLILVMGGCGVTPKSQEAAPVSTKGSESKPVTIATSFYPMYIFTLNIVRDIPNVKVVNITSPTTGCLHDYALTTEDMKRLEAAQILVINGAGMESFLEKITGQMRELKIVTASKGLETLKDHGQEENPHLWVSISQAILQVKNINDQLAALDPQRATQYAANTDQYIKKLEAQRAKMHQELQGIKSRNIVTFHEAFPYFAKEFNLNIVGIVQREPGSEPSAKELHETIGIVKSAKVKALFAEPQYPANAAKTIAKETGAQVFVLDPVVTGAMDDPDAYQKIMDQNLKTLREALN